MVKNLSANAGDMRNVGSIPGLEKFPGGGHGNPLQYSCLENPMNRGAWCGVLHGVTESQIRLTDATTTNGERYSMTNANHTQQRNKSDVKVKSEAKRILTGKRRF